MGVEKFIEAYERMAIKEKLMKKINTKRKKEKIMNYQCRQGDVFIMAVDAISGKKQKRENGKIILALGESHTHCHAIADKETDLFIDGTRKFLEVCLKQGATVQVDITKGEATTIPRHFPVTLPPGKHEVRIQKQWDYMKQLSQQVRD